MTFDTLTVAHELKDAGFSLEQSEALAKAIAHVTTAELATKADLVETKAELKQEISDIRSDVRILRWMIGFSLGLSLLILGKLFAVHS